MKPSKLHDDGFYFVLVTQTCVVPLREQVDREIGEKKKIQSDLEKTEKQKTQLATEVDEHHSAIEHMNNLNLRSVITSAFPFFLI